MPPNTMNLEVEGTDLEPCGACGAPTTHRRYVGSMPGLGTVYAAACAGECAAEMAPGGRNKAQLRRDAKMAEENARRVAWARSGLKEMPSHTPEWEMLQPTPTTRMPQIICRVCGKTRKDHAAVLLGQVK